MVDFADILPTLAEAAGISSSEYFTDGESFITILNGDNSRRNKEEVFIHYSPRWGRFQHNRWVMNEEYKLYRDGKFYNTSIDPLEENALSRYSDNEEEIKEHFNAIIQEREDEMPFEQNDTVFAVP